MPANFDFIPNASGYPPNLDDLCVGMFLEGARLLGIKGDAPMSLDAQAKILEAVASLGERLAVLLEIQGDQSGFEPELGN
jgi:hypothetical protein